MNHTESLNTSSAIEERKSTDEGDIETLILVTTQTTCNDDVERGLIDRGRCSRSDSTTATSNRYSMRYHEEDAIDIDASDATWKETCHSCIDHTPREWARIFVRVVFLLGFLYFFLFGLELLSSSAKVVGGCTAGTLFGGVANPIAALMIGILATVLIQSSSTTTSIVVTLVPDAISVETGIYIIMGANIGTSVTNTIVAMGQLGSDEHLERAFAGATVHDVFNILAVIILLPLEVITGYLYRLTSLIIQSIEVREGEKWDGPIKKFVSPLGNMIIIPNKEIISVVAAGEVQNCGEFYPVRCKDGIESYGNCKVGLVSCDKHTGRCPLFFVNGATQKEDEASGGACLFLALVIIIICLLGLIKLLHILVMGTSTRIIRKATNVNPYLAMLVGVGTTIMVQSSSITTSALTPLVGVGIIELEKMFPITLGANIGTTITAMLAALVSDSVLGLQLAFVHLFFNISGIIIWYPVPYMRNIPLNAARLLGKTTRLWKFFPIIYIIFVFLLVPALLLGLSAMFQTEKVGFVALSSMLVIFIVLGILWFFCWWNFREGHKKMFQYFHERQQRADAMKSLPDDIKMIREDIERLNGSFKSFTEADVHASNPVCIANVSVPAPAITQMSSQEIKQGVSEVVATSSTNTADDSPLVESDTTEESSSSTNIDS